MQLFVPLAWRMQVLSAPPARLLGVAITFGGFLATYVS